MAFEIDEKTSQELSPYGFDAQSLEAFASKGKQRTSNAVEGTLTPPLADDVAKMPELGTAERARLRKAGLELIAQKKVGVVILAGGMATRFGGVVKAVVPVLGKRSFLKLKCEDLAKLKEKTGAAVPTMVMSSFATHEKILSHVEDEKLGPIDVFPQFVSLRLDGEGRLFKNNDGSVSAYATGHGDFSFALRRSGVLQRFIDAGGKYLVMSNVDNLGATLDPALVALHVELGGALTAEVVRKAKGDKGGAPARLDGKPQIIEGFRFPESFDQDSIEVFNTNTFVIDADAINREFELPYYRVEKKVDGRTAVQFERLVGELTAFVPTKFVEVPRDGVDGRFLPAKDPEELASRLSMIELVANSKRSIED